MAFKNTRLQGDAGTAAALSYFAARGYPVALPFGEGQRYDLIVDEDGAFHRVQCKTAFAKNRAGKFYAELRTKGGNRAGNGKECRISAAEVDKVAILDGDGGLWVFPSEELAGRATVSMCESNAHRRVL